MRVRTIRYSPGGPSAPQGRTVRSYVFHTTRDQQRLWNNFEVSLRTVRASGADRPQFTFQPKPEKQPLSGTNLRLASGPSAPHGRTVRRSTLKPTRETPSLVHFLKKSGGPSAHLGRTGREPTRDFASSLERVRTVCPSGADCPPLLSQLSNLVFFKSYQNAVSPHACN